MSATIRALEEIDVTAEAVIATATGTGPYDVETLDGVVSALTYVMSVGAGTKVQWIYRTEMAAPDRVLRRFHAARITKPFTPQPIINSRSGATVSSKWYLERGYRALNQWERQFPVSHVIDAYLDANSEADFLEARGAKLAVALEVGKLLHKIEQSLAGGSEEHFLGRVGVVNRPSGDRHEVRDGGRRLTTVCLVVAPPWRCLRGRRAGRRPPGVLSRAVPA